MSFKIALLGIYHESNTFVDGLTDFNNFKKGHYLKGDAIRREYAEAHHEIGGMIKVLDQENMEVVPVMFAEATPGGIISAKTYDLLLNEMMAELEKVLPIDGCLVIPHGAAVSEVFSDMDGHWLSVLRQKLGDKIPIIGTLDPHANVSRLMIDATDALVAYKTNPHIDQRETGKSAARLMVQCLSGECQPKQVLTELPMAISIEQQYTTAEPCKSIFGYARTLEEEQGVLSVSFILGFPYADVREMGSSIIVVYNDDAGTVQNAGGKLFSFLVDRKDTFADTKVNISVQLSSIDESRKPVLLLDMGDNIGGGAPGNSAYLLELLEQKEHCKFFICMYDPTSVAISERVVPGDHFFISIDGKNSSSPAFIEVILIRHEEGKFTEPNPRHGGQFSFDMGKTAIVSTIKGNIIMLTSLRISPFSLRQLTSCGIDPEDYDVIIAKGVNAPIAAYAEVCPTIMQANTPGVTQADMTRFSYKNRRRPLFPFEDAL